MPESRCGQLTAIESDKENHGGKALVAWARAKNLGASSLDLLRIVKVRAADADARIRHRPVSGLLPRLEPSPDLPGPTPFQIGLRTAVVGLTTRAFVTCRAAHRGGRRRGCMPMLCRRSAAAVRIAYCAAQVNLVRLNRRAVPHAPPPRVIRTQRALSPRIALYNHATLFMTEGRIWCAQRWCAVARACAATPRQRLGVLHDHATYIHVRPQQRLPLILRRWLFCRGSRRSSP